MSSLDDKLRAILQETDITENLDYVIPAIKQAFADEGYQPIATPVLSSGDNVNYYFDRGDKNWKVVPDHLMTGQEWYNRFEKEMQGRIIPFAHNDDGEVKLMIDEIDEAAKKAAGIQDG